MLARPTLTEPVIVRSPSDSPPPVDGDATLAVALVAIGLAALAGRDEARDRLARRRRQRG